MITYTPMHNVDYYTRHLMNVNKYNRVFIKENIFDSGGILLLKKGTDFDLGVAEKILQARLLKPIDECIDIVSPLNGITIYKRINSIIKSYPFLERMHHFANINMVLKQQCVALERYPLLIQKLTVQQLQQPDEFDNAVLCAWFCLGIGKQLHLTTKQIHNVFLAALVHDIGMLHINPLILTCDGELMAAEWKTVQSHVNHGKKILDRIPGLAPTVARAVLEHHERCDGTGYPAGKIGDELCVEGRIVRMCDAIMAIVLKEVNIENRAYINLIPFLQFNMEPNFCEIYEVTMKWIRNIGYTENRYVPDNEVETLIDKVFCEEYFLKGWHEVIHSLAEAVPVEEQNGSLKVIIKASGQLQMILSGLEEVDIRNIKWASRDKENKSEVFAEIEHVYMMLKEVRWELRYLTRKLKLIYDELGNTNDSLACQFNLAFERLDKLNAGYHSYEFHHKSTDLH